MKRKIGFILTILGISLLLYSFIFILKRKNKLITPIPLKEGIKVIQLSPTP